MFIPRDDVTCQPLSCNSNQVPQGSDTGHPDYGPQRYIGVSMVAGVLFLVLLFWLWMRGRSRNAHSRFHRWCWWRKRADNIEENNKDVLVDLSPRAHLEKPKRVHIKDTGGVLEEVEQDELQKSGREGEDASRWQPETPHRN